MMLTRISTKLKRAFLAAATAVGFVGAPAIAQAAEPESYITNRVIRSTPVVASMTTTTIQIIGDPKSYSLLVIPFDEIYPPNPDAIGLVTGGIGTYMNTFTSPNNFSQIVFTPESTALFDPNSPRRVLTSAFGQSNNATTVIDKNGSQTFAMAAGVGNSSRALFEAASQKIIQNEDETTRSEYNTSEYFYRFSGNATFKFTGVNETYVGCNSKCFATTGYIVEGYNINGNGSLETLFSTGHSSTAPGYKTTSAERMVTLSGDYVIRFDQASASYVDSGATVSAGTILGDFNKYVAPTSPVPEPSTYGLMALGLLGVATLVRRNAPALAA